MSRAPSDLLPPAAALALWAELRTDPPRSPRSLHARAERLGLEPYVVNRVRLYSASELENAILGERSMLGVEVLRLVALAGALGYEVTLSASEGDDPPHAVVFDPYALLDDALYSGNIAGARRWLEEAAAEFAEGDEP